MPVTSVTSWRQGMAASPNDCHRMRVSILVLLTQAGTNMSGTKKTTSPPCVAFRDNHVLGLGDTSQVDGRNITIITSLWRKFMADESRCKVEMVARDGSWSHSHSILNLISKYKDLQIRAHHLKSNTLADYCRKSRQRTEELLTTNYMWPCKCKKSKTPISLRTRKICSTWMRWSMFDGLRGQSSFSQGSDIPSFFPNGQTPRPPV